MATTLQIREKKTDKPNIAFSLQIEDKVIELVTELTEVSLVDILRAERTEKDGIVTLVWPPDYLSEQKLNSLYEFGKFIYLWFHDAENSN